MDLGTLLQERDRPVRVGFVGVGIFGSQVIHSVAAAPGMETAAIADIEVEKAVTSFRRVGVPSADVERVETASAIDEVVAAGRRAVTTDGMAVVDADVDVVIDATGNPNVAARHGVAALMSGKHFVNVSVEADVVCGRLLADIADRNGVTYTLAYGDQPAQIVELCEWATAAGFEVVAAGKASREPEHDGTPDDSIERHGFIASFGEGLDPNPVIYNTFLDGTKTAVESVAAANALGLGIDATGMHHPTTSLEGLPEVFRPTAEGGVLESTGVIDTATITDGSCSVFVVTRTDSPQLQAYFDQRPNVLTSEDGEYQAFYRPHHFAPETSVSIASAAIKNEATGLPRSHDAEVIAAAKRDLEPGETIDGGGGYTVYGQAADATVAAEEGWVPFELLEGATVLEPIGRDEYVHEEQVEVDTDQFLYHLRGLQDAL